MILFRYNYFFGQRFTLIIVYVEQCINVFDIILVVHHVVHHVKFRH